MPKKAPSLKNRIWERDRRNRFNASFDELASLLPQHNSNNALSKVLVVQKATEFIRHLQKDTTVLQEHKDLVSQLKLEIASLKKECDFLKTTFEQSGLIIPENPVDNSIKKSDTVLSEENRLNYEVPKKNFVNTNSNEIGNVFPAKENVPRNQIINKHENNFTKKQCMEKKIDQKSGTLKKDLALISNKKTNSKIKKKSLDLQDGISKTTSNITTANACPVFIIMNDTPIIPQPIFNAIQTQNGLTFIKNQGIKIIDNNTLKINQLGSITKKPVPKPKKPRSKYNGKPVRNIASKGFKLDLNKTIILNKVPIPALKKTIIDTNLISKQRSEIKIKNNSLKRVTYRVLRQSKILKKRIVTKNKICEKTEGTRKPEQNLDDTSTIIINENTENIEKQDGDNIIVANCDRLLSMKSNPKIENKIQSTTIVTYSIDSLCNAKYKTNDVITNISKLENPQIELVENNTDISEKEQEMKKNLCMDSNSKCDPLSDLSNDIFANLPAMGNHQQGCTSPTAAFLLAFPLVSTLNGGKINQVIIDENTTETQETNPKTNAGSNLLNLDQFSTLFSSKDMYSTEHNSKISQKIDYEDKCTSSTIVKQNHKETDKIDKISISDNYSKTNSECLYTYGNTGDITTYNPNIQNNIYNFDTNNKDEKNKFSHTNIISSGVANNSISAVNSSSCLNDNNHHGVYNPQVKFSSQNQSKFDHSNISKSLPSTIASSTLNEIPLMTTPYSSIKTNCSESTTDIYNSYTPFYGSTNKDSTKSCANKFSSVTSTTPVMSNLSNSKFNTTNPFTSNSTGQDYNNIFNTKINNPDCDLEKHKFGNDYIGQELKYTKSNSGMRYKPYIFNNSITSNNNNKIKNIKEYEHKVPVNWMTSPDVRTNLNKFNIQNTSLNNYNYNNIDCSNATIHTPHEAMTKKEAFYIVPPVNNSNAIDESLNTWSNSMKIQDNQSQLNLPVTLPTLIGDLALGTSTQLLHTHNDNSKQYQSCYTEKKDAMLLLTQKENTTKNDHENHQSLQNTWSGNFSVSQLVDQFKSDKDSLNTRRNSSINSTKTEKHVQQDDNNKVIYDNSKRNIKHIDNICNVMETDIYKHNQNIQHRNHKKYSAESLLSDDIKQDKSIFRQQQFFPFVDFTSDIKDNKQYPKTTNANIIPNTAYTSYNNHMPDNYSFNKNNIDQSLSNKLSLHLSNQSSDLQTQSVIQQSNTETYKGNIYKNLTQDNHTSTNKNNINATTTSSSGVQYTKKSLKRNKSQENNINSLLDLNYLPVAAGNHSPIFNEDPFYNYPLGFTSNANSQSYQNQNILYSGNVRCHLNQLPTFSPQIPGPVVPKNLNTHLPIPSPNITNNSSSLTNFNLSTIFPEINDKIRSNW